MLVVGGTSLCERGREAPKTLGVLGLIEASANIGRVRVCACATARSRLVCLSAFRSSFYRLKEGGLHAWGISGVVFFPPESGKNS